MEKENIVFFTKEEVEQFKNKLKNPITLAITLYVTIGIIMLLAGTFSSNYTFVWIASFMYINSILLDALKMWKNSKQRSLLMVFVWFIAVTCLVIIYMWWQ